MIQVLNHDLDLMANWELRLEDGRRACFGAQETHPQSTLGLCQWSAGVKFQFYAIKLLAFCAISFNRERQRVSVVVQNWLATTWSILRSFSLKSLTSLLGSRMLDFKSV